MNPAALIPTPDTIPVHWGWFQLLLIVTFVLHLLFMNTMLGTCIMALMREFNMDKRVAGIHEDLSKKLPYTIALTVNLGVAPLLFVQVLYGQFIYTSSILMAVYWLAVIPLLIVAYYCAYIYDFKFNALGQARTIFIAVCLVLLLWIGFVFSNNMTMMLHPENWQAYFRNPFGTLLNVKDPMLMPRYLHFVVASVAVAGLFQAMVWTVKGKNGGHEYTHAVKNGLTWFTWATCIQFAVGVWFLLALPGEKMMLFLGRGALHTLLLLLAVVLGGAAVYFAVRAKVWATAGITVTLVLVMVLVRDLLRAAYLAPYFSPKELTVTAEYSPMILFFVSFAAGIAIIVYMLKLAARALKGGLR